VKPTWIAFAICLALVLEGTAPVFAQTPAPRFELSKDTVLTDEVLGIRLSGLPPRQRVTIRLSGADGAFTSSAKFVADAQGTLDLSRDAPVEGPYRRAHSMGLFWTTLRDSTLGRPGPSRQAAVRIPPAQPWQLSAEADGVVLATDTVWRYVVAPGVRVVSVRERGLSAHAYFPVASGPQPAVIILPGSLGGIPAPGQHAGGLASRGYVALALGYFAAEGLPETLSNIPLEYFAAAIDWLKSRPEVDSTRIAVLGTSRGGELALLLGATFPALRAVIANVPSHVVWPNMMGDSASAPAWTFGGKAIPGMPQRAYPDVAARIARCASAANCPGLLTVHNFLARLEDKDAAARSEIPVERINGPVLLLSGREDSLWPSAMMATRVEERLKKRNFRFPVEHYSYENAGHGVGRPYNSTMFVVERQRHPFSGRLTLAGGTPEGSALASEDAWRRIVEFLNKNLRK
jgi:dienelactone hydrolase